MIAVVYPKAKEPFEHHYTFVHDCPPLVVVHGWGLLLINDPPIFKLLNPNEVKLTALRRKLFGPNRMPCSTSVHSLASITPGEMDLSHLSVDEIKATYRGTHRRSGSYVLRTR